MTGKILLVESNRSFYNQIQQLLENEQFQVIVTNTALDAYKVTIREPIDLIISNVQLPKVSGLHLAKKLQSRSLTENIPLLIFGKRSVLTAQVCEKIVALGKSYLHLPLNKSKLLDMVRDLLTTQPEMITTTSSLFQEADNLAQHDSSQVDTDKFKKSELLSDIDKIGEGLGKSAAESSGKPLQTSDFEASKALAEITQQAEENLSAILAAKSSAPYDKANDTSNYLGWWGFNVRPFSNTPDSRFYYNSKQHSEAMTRLMHAVENMEGLAVLIGKIGSGKTTLARKMLESFDHREYVVALLVIIHSAITSDWLLRKIALQLGVKKIEDQKLLLIGQLYQRLVEIYEEGKKAVILIDEAQMLQTRDLMEEFRGLLNLEVPGKKLLTFVFFGLEELNKYLSLDEPLKQRIALKYTLHPFDRPSTRLYIIHRLRIAGVQNPVFSEDALNKIYEMAEGTPRLINTICNNALLEGYFLRKRYVDQSLIRRVGENLDLIKASGDPQA